MKKEEEDDEVPIKRKKNNNKKGEWIKERMQNKLKKKTKQSK